MGALIRVIALILTSFCYTVESKDFVRVCYYTNWSKGRPSGGAYDLQTHYEDQLCTHIIYSFGKVDHDGTGWAIKPYEEKFDIEEGYPKLNNILKRRDPNLKTLLAIGGWNHASTGFKDMVASKGNRKYFIEQSKDFLIKHGFDGLDLDWEYPAQRGSSPGDKKNFADLCAELREHYGSMLITAAVAAGASSVDVSYDVPRVAKALDFINLMSYDLHGSWAQYTGHHTDMNPNRPYPSEHSIHNTVYHWMIRGAPAHKLVLGLASYGRTYKLSQPCSDWGIGATGTWSGGKSGKSTGENGFLAYYEICKTKWVYHKCTMDSNSMAPYGTDGQDWIGYDDVESIVYKVNQVVKGKNLRGLMFWALDLDDFSGMCGGERYPLIKAAKNTALGRSVDISTCRTIKTNKCVPPTQPPKVTTKVGSNGCRLNMDGPWGKSSEDRIKKLDDWCKHPGNCPKDPHCTGCKQCMCTCDGKPSQKTTKQPSTTTIITCKPNNIFAPYPGYVRWCNNNCHNCGKRKGVENFCHCSTPKPQPKCQPKNQYKGNRRILKVLCNRYCGRCDNMRIIKKYCTCPK